MLLGEASYSLYLLHSFIIPAAFNALPKLPAAVRLAIALASSVGAALLCFALIEQPARRLLRPGRQIKQPFDQPRAAASSAAEA